MIRLTRMPRLSRLFLFGALLLALAPVFSACSSSDDNGRLQIVATIAPLGAVAREIAGDSASVATLAGPGIDPHEYSPSAGDIRRVAGAAVVLRTGLSVDAFLDKALANSGAKRVVTASNGIAIRKNEEGEDDPHVWHDPRNVKVWADNIAQALAAADPPHAEAYRQRAAAYKDKLDRTDTQVQAIINEVPPANRKLVTNHDALGYFVDRYGLQLVGAVIPSGTTQAEPSARDIADLEQTIRRERVKAIFAESSVDPKVARQVAADTGVKIVDDLYGDSLGTPGSGADTVDGMLLTNARKIADALK